MERTGDPADLTIGEFYEHILESFRRLTPAMSTARQVTAPLASMVVKVVDDVARAIGIITREGEGSDGPADTGTYDLAHYYRFAEIIEGKHLVQDPATGDLRVRHADRLRHARWGVADGTGPRGWLRARHDRRPRGPAAAARVRTSPTRGSSTCCKRCGSPMADRAPCGTPSTPCLSSRSTPNR